MRMLAQQILSMARRHPLLAVCGVLLLSGALFLPSLHHLLDHHHDGVADGDCSLCLLLNLTFLALPVCFIVTLVRNVAFHLSRAPRVELAFLARLVMGARAPPLSN